MPLVLSCIVFSPLFLGAVGAKSVILFTLLSLIGLGIHVLERAHLKRPLKTSFLGLCFFFSIPITFVSIFPFETSFDPIETQRRLLQLIAALCIFIVISDKCRSIEDRNRVDQWIFMGAALLFFTSILHRLLDIDRIWGLYGHNDTLLFAPLINTNHLSRLFGIFSLLCLSIAITTKNRFRKHGLICISTACGLGVFLTLSRGGILTFLCILGAILCLAHFDRLRSNSGVSIFVFTLVILALSLFMAYSNLLKEGQSLGNALGTHEKWVLYGPALDLIKKYWAFGIGSNSTLSVFHSMIKPDLNAVRLLTDRYDFYYVENIFLQTLLDHGVIKGALLLTLFIGSAIILIKKHFFSLQEQILTLTLGFIFLSDLTDFSFESGSVLWLTALILGICASQLSKKNQLVWHWSTVQIKSLWVFLFLLSGYLSTSQLLFSREKTDEDIALAKGGNRNSILLQATSKHPFDAQYAYWLAENNRQSRNFIQALKWAKIATSLRPTHAHAHLEQARAYFALNQQDKGLMAYRTALISNPDLTRTVIAEIARISTDLSLRERVLPAKQAVYYLSLCEQFEDDKQFNQAQTCYAQLASFKDVKREHLISGAEVALRNRDPKTTLLFLALILKKDPMDDTIATLHAKALVLLNGATSALHESTLWPTHLKQPCKLLQWRLRTLIDLEQVSADLAPLKALKNCLPEGISLKEFLDLTILSSLAAHKPAQALQAARQAVLNFPKETGFLIRKAQIELELDWVADAEQTCHQIAQVDPKNDALPNLLETVKNRKKALLINHY